MSKIAVEESKDNKGSKLKIARLRVGLKQYELAKVKQLLKPKHMESPTTRAIKVRYIAVPNASDAKERLSRAVAILLKSGMRKKKNEHREHKKETRASQSNT